MVGLAVLLLFGFVVACGFWYGRQRFGQIKRAALAAGVQAQCKQGDNGQCS